MAFATTAEQSRSSCRYSAPSFNSEERVARIPEVDN
jgi:hypothetical protein